MTDVASAQPRLSRPARMAYGFGSVAYGVKDQGFSAFLIIFYNQVVGLPADLVGLAVAVALVCDAFVDPIVGQLSDNLRTRWGRRHPFMYAAAIPVAISFFLIWNPPTGWPQPALFAYLVASAIVVRSFITGYEIPSSALVAELTNDYDERTKLLSYRWFFGVCGSAVIGAVALKLFLQPQPAAATPEQYRAYAIMAAAVMVVSILISAAGTHHRIKHLPALPPAQRYTPFQMLGAMLASLSHRSFLCIVGSGLFTAIGIGVASALGAYFAIYFWRLSADQMAILGLAGLVAAVASLFLAPLLSNTLGKRNGAMALALASIVLGAWPMLFMLAGWMPPPGSAALLAVLFVNTVLVSAFAIAGFVLQGSMIADVVEDSALSTGRRSEGLFFSASAFVQKAISGVGALVAGLLLKAVEFPQKADPATLDPAVMHHLVLIYIPTTVVVYLIATALLGSYRISREGHEANLAKLADAARAHVAEGETVAATAAARLD